MIIVEIGDYNSPRMGNPELNQPGFNGMIEGSTVATAHMEKKARKRVIRPAEESRGLTKVGT